MDNWELTLPCFVNNSFINHSLAIPTYLEKKNKENGANIWTFSGYFINSLWLLENLPANHKDRILFWTSTLPRVASQGRLTTPSPASGTTAAKARTLQELPFSVVILVPCLRHSHAACSRQLVHNFDHPQSAPATVNTLWEAYTTSLLANRQRDGPCIQDIMRHILKKLWKC